MNHQNTLDRNLQELDPQALSAVHDEYFPKIYRYAYQRLSDQHQAEDAASEVFTRLVESIHEGRGPSRSLSGWLFQTASNVINDVFRQQYQHPVEELDEQIKSPQDPPEAQVTAGLGDPALRAAMDTLTSSQREVLALRFAAELSLAETAEVMNKSINAVKALQFRAVTSLRQSMGGPG